MEKNLGHHFVTFMIDDTPTTYFKAIDSTNSVFLKEAIDDECKSIMSNNTTIITSLSCENKPLGCKWVFRKKLRLDESIEKFKTRLVAKGFK